MSRSFKLNSLILLVLVFTSANIGLKASHIIGAEVNYTFVKDNIYKFNLKVYRDCNECKFDNNGGGNSGNNCPEVPNLKVKGAWNSMYSGQEFGDVVLSRIKIEDKTPTCFSSISKCKIGSTINYGFELHEFEGYFNFSGLILSGKCEFDISIAMSSRNPALNSAVIEQNFFNYTYLNLCNGIKNTSTRFELSPIFVLLQNQTHSISLGVMNDDKDSLSFKLKTALLNRSAGITYSIGKTSDRPYSVFCTSGVNCPANPNAPLAEGFYISETTGDVIFTPVSLNEGGVIVVECEEWKNDAYGKRYLAGVTRRDIYAEVIFPSNNLPKIKNSEIKIDVCEGDQLNYKLNIEDLRLFSPLSDSVKVSVISNIADLNLSKKILGIAPYNFYELELSNTIGKKGKYSITITAIDNNCPLSGISSKTLELQILEKRKLEYTVKTKNCGVLQIENKTKNQNARWTLLDLNNQVLKNQIGEVLVHQLTQGGKYILKASLESTNKLCAINIVDTIFIDDFIKPEFEIGKDQKVCKNNAVSITPVMLKTFDNYKVMIGNTQVNFPYNIIVKDNTRLTFKIVQDNGCYAEDVINVNPHSQLMRNYSNDTICSNMTGSFNLKQLLNSDWTKISSLDFSSPNNEIEIDKIDPLNSSLTILIPKNTEVKLYSAIKDINGCDYKDTFLLHIIDPKPIDIRLVDNICANSKVLILPMDKNGNWKCSNYPGNLIGNQLLIQPPMNGKINLEYTESNQCTNSKVFEVNIIDTIAISLLNGNNLIICENSSPLVLSAIPSNGSWSGSFVSQNIFYPSSAGNTINVLKYQLVSKEGCISENKLTIEVKTIPEFTIQSNKSIICVGDELILTANCLGGILNGYWFSSGDGRFDHPEMLSTIYIPSTNDIKKGTVNFTFTVQTNTVCGNVTEGIDIKINEAPTGSILKNYAANKCEPAAYKFDTDFKNITKQYWYVNDTLVEDFDYEFAFNVLLRAGTYTIRTEVLNGDCPAIAYADPIEIYSTPVTNFIANPNYRLSREYSRLYLKDITKNKNPFTSKWYFNNTLIDESKEFYYNVSTPGDTFNIKLLNTSSMGACENSMSKQFVFSPINQLYIPDAFTPDAKGPDENNEFKIKGPPMQYFYIEIYNKWGAVVYYSKDMNAAWDGTYDGKSAIPGVYFYKVNSTDTDGISRDYSGTVTLMR